MIELHSREINFLLESNSIEGIRRELTDAEVQAFIEFMEQEELSVDGLCAYVKATANGKLRSEAGMNVTVDRGKFVPIAGGMTVVYKLENLLERVNGEEIAWYDAHVEYETLHPFTDGNGRSGRMIWWWMIMGEDDGLGFLQNWYYESLRRSEVR